ncbi:MAG TPA: hypothetical protein VGQ17_09970 [Gemmatimonadales bacterium]|nr:hypothetical protein [Gemmatimonadales bacterium]
MARTETAERMEVFDEQGHSVGRVTWPTDPRLFGPNKGTVYLQRPLPTEQPASRPAQAA